MRNPKNAFRTLSSGDSTNSDADASNILQPAAGSVEFAPKIVVPYSVLFVQVGHYLQVPAGRMTAAFAVDSYFADATISDGSLNVYGKVAGQSQILVVTDAGIRSIAAQVIPSTPIYPPGFVLPPSQGMEEGGDYEIRLTSDRWQLQNRFDFRVRRGERTTQFHLVNTNFLQGSSSYTGAVSLPSGFYRITTPRWDVALLDQVVKNSPLTLNGATIRGLHMREGPWVLHAGYSTLATFEDFLLPVQSEAVVGGSYIRKIGTHGELTPNIFFIQRRSTIVNNLLPNSATPSRGASTLGSVVYRFKSPRRMEFLAEAGLSGGGAGAAAELEVAGRSDSLRGRIQNKPKNFPQLTLEGLPGLISELFWTHQVNPKLGTSLNLSGNRLQLPLGQQTNITSTGNLIYRLTRHWTVSSGAGYAEFKQKSPNLGTSLHSLDFPQEISFDLPHFGASFQYQYTQNSKTHIAGEGFRPGIRFGWSRLMLSGYIQQQKQALTVDSLYSDIPSLRQELLSRGITATTPEQIAALLQDSSFLLALGFAQSAHLNLVPTQWQAGANLDWTSADLHKRLNLNFSGIKNETLNSGSREWVQSGSYTHHLSKTNEITVSYSLFRSPSRGQSAYLPIGQISLRHIFSTAPLFLAPPKHGIISGTVFLDAQNTGAFDKGMQTFSGIEVILDGINHSKTDGHGRYIFTRVVEGPHTLEVRYKSEQPFWYTTPSNAAAQINQIVDFGIAFADCKLIGYVKNDAGAGVEGVDVHVADSQHELTVRTDGKGKFLADKLNPGSFEVKVDPNALPAGYSLEGLDPAHVELQNGVPGRVGFTAKAFRTISGEVVAWNAKALRYVPVTGATVTLSQLAKQVTTDPEGRFLFRDLSSGSFTVEAAGLDMKASQTVTIPAEPASINLKLTLLPPRQ